MFGHALEGHSHPCLEPAGSGTEEAHRHTKGNQEAQTDCLALLSCPEERSIKELLWSQYNISVLRSKYLELESHHLLI